MGFFSQDVRVRFVKPIFESVYWNSSANASQFSEEDRRLTPVWECDALLAQFAHLASDLVLFSSSGLEGPQRKLY